MMQVNKATFDNSYAMIMSAYEQNKLMLTLYLSQSSKLPDEGKDAIENWLQTFRKGCEDLKKMADEGYKMMETYMAAAEKQNSA